MGTACCWKTRTEEERATQLLVRLPENKWRWNEHGGFASELGIPYDEQNSIAENNNRVSAAVKWLQENQQMFWRAIVCALDAVKEGTLADEVREFLEPPAEVTLTNKNVSYVMKEVQDIDTVSQRLHIPTPVRRRFGIHQPVGIPHHRPNVEPIKSIDVGKYWRNTVPSASWESLACVLYSLREDAALQRVTEFLQRVRDPSLNVQNIQQVMEGEQRIPDLDVPNKRGNKDTFGWQEIQLSNDERIQEYVYSHPCPSWSHIKRQLQDMELTEAAERVSQFN